MDYSAFYSITSVRIRVIIPVITIPWIIVGSLVHIFFTRFTLLWPHYNSLAITNSQEINHLEKDIFKEIRGTNNQSSSTRFLVRG